MWHGKTVSVVLASYREKDSIRAVIDGYFATGVVDEVIAVGDARFQERCKKALFVERASQSLVLVSHQEKMIRQYCEKAYVLHHGALHEFPTLDEAFAYYKGVLQ